MEQRIIIRHLGPENRVQEFSVDSLVEVTFGREESCSVQFVPGRDEMVSRRHARLTVANRNPLAIAFADLGSRNGTFVNHHRVEGQVLLNPGDRVQLGAGGPEFEVDVYPRSVPGETMITQDVPKRVQPGVTMPMPVMPPGPVQRMPPPPPPMRPPSTGSGARTAVLACGIGFAILGLALLGAWFMFANPKGNLSMKVYWQPDLITVAYKTYGNSEAASGKYWFAKSVIQNTGKGSLKNVRISYQIADYIPWTTPDEVAEILPGETVVFVYYPKFPSKITNIRTLTPATLEVKVESDNVVDSKPHIEKRDFEIRGVTEFAYTSMPQNEILTYYDVFDNAPLLASFVTDEDPVVKTFYAKVSEAYGGISTMDHFKDMVVMARSVYNYMVSLGMTYSGSKGVPESTGDVQSMVQSIRMPRDVIYGNSGLCIELALLWCSIAQAAGAHAYLILIPGHAFVILESGDGQKLPIECTGILGGSGGNMQAAVSFEAAVDYANKNLQKILSGSAPFQILDIRSYQAKGIRPPELESKDVAELSQLLDDRRHGAHRTVEYRPVANNGGGQTPPPAPRATDNGTQMRRWVAPNNSVAIVYPADWQVDSAAIARVRSILPGYAFAAADLSRHCSIEVAFFTAPNLQAALAQFGSALRQLGAAANLGSVQQVNIGGRAVAMFPLTVSGGGTVFAGRLIMAPVRGGFVLIDSTAAQPGAANWQPIMDNMLSRIQFGS